MVVLMFDNFGRRVTERNSLQTIRTLFLILPTSKGCLLKLSLELCRDNWEDSSQHISLKSSDKDFKTKNISQSRGQKSQRVLSLNTINILSPALT